MSLRIQEIIVDEKTELEIVDLGDAVEETKQAAIEPPMFWDSLYGWFSRYGD